MCVFLYYYQYSVLLESSQVGYYYDCLYALCCTWYVRTVSYRQRRRDELVPNDHAGWRACLAVNKWKWSVDLIGRYVCTLLWWIACCLKNEERTTATVPIDTIRFDCMPAPERESKRKQISHCVSQRLQLQLRFQRYWYDSSRTRTRTLACCLLYMTRRRQLLFKARW